MSPGLRPTFFFFPGPPSKASGHEGRSDSTCSFRHWSYRCDIGAYIDVQPRLRSAYANPVTGTWAIVTPLLVVYNKSFHRFQLLTGHHQCQIPGQQEQYQLCESLLLGYETEWSSVDTRTVLTPSQ